MTKDEVLKLALEAGGYLAELPNGDAWLFSEDEYLKRFAALIASAEREACAKLCDEIATEDGWEGGYAYRCVEAILERGLA